LKANFFRSPEEFQHQSTGYQVLPFRFMRWNEREVFVSNDVGESAFLSSDDFGRFVSGGLASTDPIFADLKAKHLLTDSGLSLPVQLLATKYRTKKSFLDGFTKLHMFVVTLRCDHTCPYCQVSRVTEDRVKYDMTEETAIKATEFLFRSPSPDLKVEFQGGESLLNFDAIRTVVHLVEQRNVTARRQVEFVIATNLSRLTDEMLAFCAEHDIHLSTSLDGPAFLHNSNRPRPGRDSHERLVANLGRARERLGHDQVSALMTTTVDSLGHPQEIVDEYVALGFDSVFVRPISPYGFAIRTRQAFRYQTDAFVAFYKTALERIIEWNLKGRPLVEVYSQILLRKILTPFPTGYVDLQSPAGAGISAVVYNYDGDVYASDEGRMLAEMSDWSFRLGNLHRDSYESIMGGERIRTIAEQSVTDTMPGCSECAFMPFCGADPVFHWATQGDMIGHRPTSAFCRRNMATIRHLLDLLRTGDDFTRSLLTSWGTH
jgi:His-Xaa-Ser system radical SAM maturase HxsB